MFNEIIKLRPYFRSIREFDGKVSLDLIIPIKWVLSFKELENSDTVEVLIQDSDEDSKLISIIGDCSNVGYDLVLYTGETIINYNVEQIKKEKLYNDKIQELQELFKTQSLDSLVDLNFNVNGK